MAEALLNTLGGGRFKAYSAGSHATGQVHPMALELIKRTDYPLENLRSKNFDEFARAQAPQMDFVITVCDSAAGEICPVWPGQPLSAHWSFADPAATEGSDEEKRRVFEQIFHQIATRVRLLVNLPLASLDRMSLQKELHTISKK